MLLREIWKFSTSLRVKEWSVFSDFYLNSFFLFGKVKKNKTRNLLPDEAFCYI